MNFFGFAIGLLISPIRTFHAFVRGRQSRNLYAGDLSRDEINQATVGGIRSQLGLDNPIQRPQVADLIWFTVWTLPVVVALVTPLGLVAWAF